MKKGVSRSRVDSSAKTDLAYYDYEKMGAGDKKFSLILNAVQTDRASDQRRRDAQLVHPVKNWCTHATQVNFSWHDCSLSIGSLVNRSHADLRFTLWEVYTRAIFKCRGTHQDIFSGKSITTLTAARELPQKLPLVFLTAITCRSRFCYPQKLSQGSPFDLRPYPWSGGVSLLL